MITTSSSRLFTFNCFIFTLSLEQDFPLPSRFRGSWHAGCEILSFQLFFLLSWYCASGFTYIFWLSIALHYSSFYILSETFSSFPTFLPGKVFPGALFCILLCKRWLELRIYTFLFWSRLSTILPTIFRLSFFALSQVDIPIVECIYTQLLIPDKIWHATTLP